MYCIVLHCSALHCSVMYCTVLYCTVLHWTALYLSALHCSLLHRIPPFNINPPHWSFCPCFLMNPSHLPCDILLLPFDILPFLLLTRKHLSSTCFCQASSLWLYSCLAASIYCYFYHAVVLTSCICSCHVASLNSCFWHTFCHLT